jgi:hypothetical protein
MTDSTLAYRKRHGSAFATAGDPDIHGVWRGIPFEIELKQVGQNPTPLQTARLQEWSRAGSLTFVVHTPAEFDAALQKIATFAKCIAL